jgi:hypothetical protein
MCGAIDTTLGAIPSGTVHSRVGTCDPRGLFAKRVLHDDSHHALAITSLRCLIQENMVYKCANPLPLLRHQGLNCSPAVCVVTLDGREAKEEHQNPCIAQVTVLREVTDASPLPPRGPHSLFIYLRPSRAIHKCVPHRAGDGSVEGHRCGG